MWEFHVDIWQNIEGDPLTTEKKRELINESIDWHRHKGTRYAVDQMLKIVFGQGRVTEWYEYGGEPYFFRILFEGRDQRQRSGIESKEAVYAVKNVRSWLDEFIQARQQRQQLWQGIVRNATHYNKDQNVSMKIMRTKTLKGNCGKCQHS